MKQLTAALLLLSAGSATADWTDLGNEQLERYFATRVEALESPLHSIRTAEEWQQQAPLFRRQMFEMLSLDPVPERTPLQATVTGTLERDDFRVENLHFQSRPGLYVTANLYLPKRTKGKAPAVLYVCGHGRVKVDGVSYGNKVNYHHHGVWFARNGYVCLVIDTVQLGEIEGIHHGTYRYERWWWNARGYTSAGVEAWNCIRALDYLESRPEVDPKRMGVTGRSGGGAYSWWAATLDERVQAAVPVAGITSLRNHVVDGCIEGHCDCMFPVNTYRWDFEKVAALVAPRPLLISNTDKDRIFPIEGVFQVYQGTRNIYELLGAGQKLGLNVEEGPHKDTQPLRTSAFHWMNRHLRGSELTDTFEMAATKPFEPRDLKVFAELPTDEINTTIDESFVPVAPLPNVPSSEEAWKSQAATWRNQLSTKSFRGWPKLDTPSPAQETFREEKDGIRFQAYHIATEPDVTCTLYLIHRSGLELKDLDLLVLNALDHSDWEDFLTHLPSRFPTAFEDVSWPEPDPEQIEAELKMHGQFKWGMAYFCPRGIGPDAWSEDAKKQTQIRRRFALIGQTRDAMRTWDIRQAMSAVRELGLGERPLWIQAAGSMAGNALYASLFAADPATRLDLHDLPSSHHEGPIFLNVLRVLDLPQAAAMAAERSQVRLYTEDSTSWSFLTETAEALGWDKKQVQIRKPSS